MECGVHGRCARALHPAVAVWFCHSFPEPDATSSAGMAGDRARSIDADLAPTGSGKTLTAFLWCINRLMFETAPSAVVGVVFCTSRRSRRWRIGISSGIFGRRWPVSANRANARGDVHQSPAIAVRTRQHASDRARALPEGSFRHPHHHPGVALPSSDVECPGSAAQHRYGDHRRDPRARLRTSRASTSTPIRSSA